MADPIIDFDTDELPPAVVNQLANQTLIEGAVLLEWWRRQSRSYQQNLMDALRTSLENGESTQQATTRIFGGTIDGVRVPGVFQGNRRQAQTIVRTAINEITTRARMETLEDMPEVKAWQQISTLDNRTSDICIAYAGKVWEKTTLEPIGHNLPFNDGTPRHFNCRSDIIPVLASFEELGFDIGELPEGLRASMDGTVPGDITFDSWLRSKSKRFQDDLLGPGRADLWRTGKITLTQLVDMQGNPMTLEQLEALAGI